MVIIYDYLKPAGCGWCEQGFGYRCSCMERGERCESFWCPVDDELDPERACP